MDAAKMQQAVAHEREILLGTATDILDVSFGRIVISRQFPQALSHNVALVEGPADAADVVVTIRAALKPTGVEWASVWCPDEGWAEQASESLSDNGYTRMPQLYMVWSGVSDKRVAVQAEHVAFAEMRQSIIVSWLGTGRTEENSAALADRSGSYAQDCDLSYFGVRGDGMFDSFCEVQVRGTVGQIDNVITHEAAQGRGYASAVVHAACRYLKQSGCEFIFLCTDADDWPQQLYRRLGFRDIGIRSHFE